MATTESAAALAAIPRRQAQAPAADRLRSLGLPDLLAFGVILLACTSSYAPATATALLDPSVGSTTLWTFRPIGPLNLVELGFLIVAYLWLLVPARPGARASSLDAPLTLALGIIVGLHLVALVRGEELLLFQLLDAERVAMLPVGYLLASRLDLSRHQLLKVVAAIGLALVVFTSYRVVRYGLIESTEFGSSIGRESLLITDDTLLVGWAVVIAWGLLVDGLLSRREQVLTLLLALAVFAVNLQSVRRGALIFITGAMVLRSLRASRRHVVNAAVTVVIVAAVAVVLLPPVAHTAGYIVESAALATSDASSGERKAELRSFSKNVQTADDLLLGRGLGAAYTAYVSGPVSLPSFGKGESAAIDIGPIHVKPVRETASVRVGWHIYGLDWLYKNGLVGTILVAGLVAFVGARTLRALRSVDSRLRSVGYSLGVLSAVLLVFLYVDPRLAFFCGVSAGLLSKILDLGAGRSWPRPTSPAA